MGKLWAALLLFLALTVSGCRIVSTEGGERQAVEYTVLRGEALPPEVERLIREQEGQAKAYSLDCNSKVKLTVTIPAKGYTWFVIE